MVTIIKGKDFGSVKPDTRRRVILPAVLVREGVSFRIYTNGDGQIVLDPQVTIPASELWLFEDKEALASVDKGMVESMNGQVMKRGSFAKYVKNAA